MPRRTRGGLAAWLKDASTPLYLTDSRRVVLFFNRGCEALTGWSAADVVGRTCDFASEPSIAELDALTCALCPPPEALAGLPTSMRVEVPSRTPSLLHARTALFIPLPGDDADELRILCAWLPVTDAPDLPHPTLSPSSLHAELARVREDLSTRYQLDQVIARSAVMQRVLAQLQLAGQSGVAVHLTGPAGAGRDFLARVIHHRTARSLRPFVPLDCAALSALELQRTLLRALLPDDRGEPSPELRPGALLLRNVSRMPRDVQQSLLEILTGVHGQPDVSIYSLDSAPLATMVDNDQLLPELFYRLTTVTIEIPPLRERIEDLPLLAQFFLERQNRNGDRQLSGLSAEVLQQLRQYNWPGNIRELRAVIEEAHAAAAGSQIQLIDLPFRFRSGLDAQRTSPPRETQPLDLEAFLREIEAREIRRVLGECRENRAKAARLLGLTRTKLYRRIELLGIESVTTPLDGDEQ